MKRTALLLGAWLLLAGAVRAAGPDMAPMPKAETVSSMAPAVAGDCGCGDGCASCADTCKSGHLRRLWEWLTWRPMVGRFGGCCHQCNCGDPPVYTFFICRCGYPQAHIPWTAFIGQNLPLCDHCRDVSCCGRCNGTNGYSCCESGCSGGCGSGGCATCGH